MKTARITFLGTADFKWMLEQEASAKRISIGELIRTRFSSEPTAEERELAQLAALRSKSWISRENALTV